MAWVKMDTPLCRVLLNTDHAVEGILKRDKDMIRIGVRMDNGEKHYFQIPQPNEKEAVEKLERFVKGEEDLILPDRAIMVEERKNRSGPLVRNESYI